MVLNTTSFHEPAECNECRTRDREVVPYLRVTALDSDRLGAGPPLFSRVILNKSFDPLVLGFSISKLGIVISPVS